MTSFLENQNVVSECNLKMTCNEYDGLIRRACRITYELYWEEHLLMYIIGYLIEELDHDYDEVTVTIGYKSIEYKTFVEKYLSMQASLVREEWYCFWEKEESINFEIFTGYPNIVDDKEIGLSGGSYGYYTENYQKVFFF